MMSQPLGLWSGIDVSSAQGTNINALITQYVPDVCVPKAYQSVELGGNGARYTVAQAKTAADRGLRVPFYGWIYAGIDGAKQAASVLDTVRKTGVTPPFVVADVETYTDGSYPTIATVLAFLGEIERQRYKPAVYTAKFMWDGYYGSDTRLSAYPLWAAQYDNVKTLDSVKLFGGWTRDKVIGKQWAGSPVDQSVFDAAFF